MIHSLQARLLAAVAACVLFVGPARADDQPQAPPQQPSQQQQPSAGLTLTPATEPAGNRPLTIVLTKPMDADSPSPAAVNYVRDAYIAFTDAQAPAAALLQANDAHRRAYAEVAACKNCHGDVAGDRTRWARIVTDGAARQQELQAVTFDLEQ